MKDQITLSLQAERYREALKATNEADIAWDDGPWPKTDPGVRYCVCSRPIPPGYTREICDKCMRSLALNTPIDPDPVLELIRVASEWAEGGPSEFDGPLDIDLYKAVEALPDSIKGG